MIGGKGGDYVWLECDECGESSQEAERFNDMIAQAKDDGWKITMDRGQYHHECPTCSPTLDRIGQARRLLGI